MHSFTCGFNKQASLSTHILIPSRNGNEFWAKGKKQEQLKMIL